MTETAANEVPHEQIPRRREKQFEGVFSFMNRKVRHANKGRGTTINTIGDKGNSAKTFLGSEAT